MCRLQSNERIHRCYKGFAYGQGFDSMELRGSERCYKIIYLKGS